jgi:MFS family permease
MSKNTKYFDGKISASFVSLLTGRMLMFVASGLLGLFFPIFLFQLFDNSYSDVFMFYGVSSLLYVIAIPFGVRFFDKKLGLQRSLRLSLVFLALFYVAAYFVEKETVLFFIPLAVVLLTLFRILFWTPFRTDIAKFTNKKNRGRQMSSFEAIRMFLAVLLPLISAFLINKFSFDVLFIIAIFIYLLTIIPFKTLPPTKENFSWKYKETFKHFFHSLKNKKVTLAFLADGFESFAALIIWPIFIFELLEGDFMKVGILSSVIILITIVLQLSLGKFIDKRIKKDEMLKWGSTFYAIGWILKVFVLTAFHVFVAGAYHSITKIFTATPYQTLSYDLSAREGHYVDEYSVIMEMAIHTGRFLMFVLGIVLISFIGIQWVFVMAALASLALNFVNSNDLYFHKHRK